MKINILKHFETRNEWYFFNLYFLFFVHGALPSCVPAVPAEARRTLIQCYENLDPKCPDCASKGKIDKGLAICLHFHASGFDSLLPWEGITAVDDTHGFA